MDCLRRNVCLSVVVAGVFLLGCGKDEPQPTAVPLQQGGAAGQQATAQPAAAAQPVAVTQPAATPTAAPTATGQANPMANLMGALGALQGQGQQQAGQPVATIAWQSLTQALPSAAPGWTLKGSPKGESVQMMGVSVAQASCELTQGNMTAEVEIVDTSMNPMLAVPFSMARSVQVDSSEERLGPINFGDHPGTQRFDKKSNKAEVMVLVKNRVMVTVKVQNAPAESAAVGIMQYVNFNHLSSLVEG